MNVNGLENFNDIKGDIMECFEIKIKDFINYLMKTLIFSN